MKSGTETAAVETKGAGRLASLDAVRGFDMFFIMGGEGLVVALAALFCFPDFGKSFDHVPWDGLQFMDTIFPTFLFLAFYAVIDVLGFVKWSFPLKVIGMNSIAIYMAQVVIGGWKANDFLFSWAWRHLPESCGDLKRVLMNLGYTVVCWLFLYFLYRKNTFLKV